MTKWGVLIKVVKILEVEKKALKRIDMMWRFACCKYFIKQGSVINIKESNITFVKPRIIEINNINYLMFGECDDIFVNGYDKKIKFKDFETYFKSYF